MQRTENSLDLLVEGLGMKAPARRPNGKRWKDHSGAPWAFQYRGGEAWSYGTLKTLRKYNEITPSKGKDLRISEYPTLNQCFLPEIRQVAQGYSESSQYSKPPLIVFACGAVNLRGHQPSRLLTTEIRPCYSGDVVGIIAAVGAMLAAVTDGMISPSEGQTAANLLEAQRKGIEASEVEDSIRAVEAAASRPERKRQPQ